MIEKSGVIALVALSLLLGCAVETVATQVIANWDVVPFQRITQPFKAGVVAFHETGADVEFMVNSQLVARVADPTWNDRTGVYEYWIEINPTDYANGLITLSATAHPDGAGHDSRALADLTLYADAADSLISYDVKWVDADYGSDTTGDGSEANPYQTIKQGVLSVDDGGTVYLKASTNYTLHSIGGSEFTYWTSITCAPGLTADDVHIATYATNDTSSTGRYNKSGLKWGEVNFYCDRVYGDWGSLFYLPNPGNTWFDGTVFYDKNGRWANTTIFNSNGQDPYCTGCYAHDLTNVNNTGILQRGNRFEAISADIFRAVDNLTAINTEIRLMDKGETSAHPDWIQFYNNDATDTMENIIIYNCKTYDMMAQGIFGSKLGGARDVAFVNLLLEKDPPESSLTSQVSGSMDHVLLWNTTIVDQTFSFRDDTSGMTHWDVRNCVFNTFSAGDQTNMPTCAISHNHIDKLTWEQDFGPLGTDATVGDALFVDYDNDDYRLQTNSPAYKSGTPLPGVPADVDGHMYDPISPNRGAFSAGSPGEEPPVNLKASLTGIVVDSSLIRARFNGGSKTDYAIEASSNLQDWATPTIRIANSVGDFDVAEVMDPLPTCRFFRVTPR